MINLSASSLELTELPPEIGLLVALEELDLELNLITELPSEIMNLENLKHLFINYNCLCDLPSSLEDWINSYVPDTVWKPTQTCN